MKPAKHFESPQPLRPDHELDDFDCGEPELNFWLQERSLQNENSGASRTYVVCETGSKRVAAYYCLATGAVQRASAPGGVRRNMPEPIPVIVLGRLAVALTHQGCGLGRGLLRDAVLRTLQAADIAGIHALLVHALSDEACEFYKRWGFQPSPMDPNVLMIRLSDAKQVLGN